MFDAKNERDRKAIEDEISSANLTHEGIITKTELFFNGSLSPFTDRRWADYCDASGLSADKRRMPNDNVFEWCCFLDKKTVMVADILFDGSIMAKAYPLWVIWFFALVSTTDKKKTWVNPIAYRDFQER